MIGNRLIFSLLGLVCLSTSVHADVQPDASIPLGRSASAFALSEDGLQAVAVNLFPRQADDGVEGANLSYIDLSGGQVTRQARVGTRLTSVAIAGQTVVIVNQDEDTVRLLNLDEQEEIPRVFSGSRPATALRLDSRTVAIANGTSGDIAFLDVEQRLVTSRVTVGDDPRMLTAHAGGRYLYAVLGATGAVATVDRQSGGSLVGTRAELIANPVAIEASPDGSRLVLVSPTSNSISVLDTTNPAAPQLLYNLAAGENPVSVAFHPVSPQLAFVANRGGNYISVVDTSADRQDALIGVVGTLDAGAQLAFDSEGDRLFLLSSSADSALYTYDGAALLNRDLLEPAPAIEIPGEPSGQIGLTATGSCQDDFHIARVTLGDTEDEGYWGLEVGLTEAPRELTGGFNLGGVLEADGGLPSFGAFSLSRTQTVRIAVTGSGYSGQRTDARVELRSNSEVLESAQGELDVTGSLSFERELAPGFYVVRLRSLAGAPRGNFQMALEAPGGSFNGGVVVGGFLDRRSDGTSRNGFGAFCLPSSQAVRFKSFGRAEYGPVGAESIIVSMLDNDRNLIDSFDTSLLSSVDVSLPEPPEMPPSVTWYVDDDAAPGGSGSASHPFRSITDAINSAAPGQTILVRPGTYGPSTTGETLPIGTRGPGLTGFDENVQLIGSGAETTIIDAELQPGIAVVLNADGVRLAGFTVKRAGSVGVYVFRSDGVTVENNHFTGNQRFGAGGELSSALIVRNNNAVGNVESGFAFSGSVPTVPRAEAAGVCPDSPTGNEYGAWIHDNNSSNNRAVGILLTQGGNYCVADNVLVNNGSSGVELNNRDQENVGRPPLNGVVIRNRIETNGGQQFSYAGTGILATENGATIDLIEDNRLIRNRPYGIGVFLEGRVGTIRNNQVLSSVSNAVLVRLDSEVDDIVDNIITGSGDSGILIANEGWVGRTSNNLIARNNKGLSVLSNSRLVTSEFDRIEDNARIGLEIVDANLDESTGCDILRNGIESAESGNGIQIRGSATALIRACRVDDNFGQGGVYAGEGAKIVFDGVEFHGNRRRGVLATDDGTTVEINDSFISGTLRLDGANADYGYGVSSRLGARIDCSETVIQSNEGGSVFAVSGTAEGCN